MQLQLGEQNVHNAMDAMAAGRAEFCTMPQVLLLQLLEDAVVPALCNQPCAAPGQLLLPAVPLTAA
jgi:hypothetical protein